MAVQYSIQKMVSDGTLSTIVLGIQYLQRNDIYMRIAGEETPPSGAPSGYTWSFIDNATLKILPVIPNGVEVVVYRRTDIDSMYNIYSQNAQFDESTIDENNQQLLFIAQEYLEQGIPGAGVESLEYLYTLGGVNYYRFTLTDGSYTPAFEVPDGTLALRTELSAVDGIAKIGSASYADIRVYTGTNTVINVYGKSNIFDGGHGIFRVDAADTTSVDNNATVIVDSLGRRWKRVFLGPVQSKWFCVGDGVADDTVQLQKAVNYSVSKKIPLHLNNGDYKYSSLDLTGITSGSVISGDGSLLSKLVYTGAGNAFVIDAFYSGSPTAPFIHSIELGGFSIVGANATKLFVMQGVARSKFADIKVNGSSVGNTDSVGVELKGVMLSTFERVMCSYEFGATPYRGLVLDEGRRAGVSVGGCSNNTFISAYLEGNAIGVQLKDNGADQNTFIGGSPESCSAYGLLVGVGCRYNTFIGVGFENLNATADVVDSGISSEYLNCYSSQSFIVDSTNRSVRVNGGFFERFQINSGAKGQDVRDIVVNHWDTGSGGFVNNGVGLKFSNIWDADQNKFIYPLKDRVAVTVGASPYTILNDELVPIKFRVYGGTVDIVQILRGTDSWVEPNPSAAGGGVGMTGIYIVMPGESLKLTYSVTPTVNKILLNNS